MARANLDGTHHWSYKTQTKLHQLQQMGYAPQFMVACRRVVRTIVEPVLRLVCKTCRGDSTPLRLHNSMISIISLSMRAAMDISMLPPQPTAMSSVACSTVEDL